MMIVMSVKIFIIVYLSAIVLGFLIFLWIGILKEQGQKVGEASEPRKDEEPEIKTENGTTYALNPEAIYSEKREKYETLRDMFSKKEIFIDHSEEKPMIETCSPSSDFAASLVYALSPTPPPRSLLQSLIDSEITDIEDFANVWV